MRTMRVADPQGEIKLNHHPFVLLVHDQPHPLESLKPVLRDLSVETFSVRTCEEAGQLITHSRRRPSRRHPGPERRLRL